MAGDDEVRARVVLADMQLRISQGPHYALGLPDTASPEDVRAAFLALTKQFHPARFGRMSPDLQRLSNEVFLGIKSAHDALVRIVGAPRGRTGPLRGTGGLPPIAPSTGPLPRRSSAGTAPPATQPVQFAHGTDRSAPSTAQAGQSGAIPRAAQSGPIPQAGQSGAIPRTAQSGSIPQAGQSGSMPNARTPSGQVPPLQRPGAPSPTGSLPRPTPSGLPPRAPSDGFNPPTVRGGTLPAATNFNVATQRGVPPQSAGARVASSRTSQSHAIPAVTNFDIATQRGVVPTQPLHRIAPQGATTGSHAVVFDESAALTEALALMEARNWSTARHALHALAAKVPQSKQYRALLCYARGREAHVAGRAEEALIEYQRALHLDPDLAQVKQAVAELQRRR